MPANPSPAPAHTLRIGGITPLTTTDFPGRLAAVLYCQGCPWRCSYCHNPELLDATTPAEMDWPQVLAFLRKRQGLLDGVVFSGGEPTLQAGLPQALEQVRALGFATALHTGGMYPERLAAVLPLLDWVGLDIKGPEHRYADITGAPSRLNAAPPGTPGCMRRKNFRPWATSWLARACATGPCRFAAVSPARPM